MHRNAEINPNQVNLQQQHQQQLALVNNSRVPWQDSATSVETPSQCPMFASAASVGLNASTAKPLCELAFSFLYFLLCVQSF